MEELTPIPGFSRYYATSDGSIYNRNKKLKPRLHNGYEVLCIYSDIAKKTRNVRVHRLIAITFIGQQPSPKHQINHKDCNKLNNNASNLEWLTPTENMQAYYSSHGQLDTCRILFEEPNGTQHYYQSMRRAARELGVALSTIWSATFEGTYKGCKITRL